MSKRTADHLFSRVDLIDELIENREIDIESIDAEIAELREQIADAARAARRLTKPNSSKRSPAPSWRFGRDTTMLKILGQAARETAVWCLTVVIR